MNPPCCNAPCNATQLAAAWGEASAPRTLTLTIHCLNNSPFPVIA